MDSQKVIQVCGEYEKLILTHCREAGSFEPLPRRLPAGLTQVRVEHANLLHYEHLLFMAEEIPRLLDAGRTEKAMRWLGWLQGACWGLGLETLEEAKLRNAPEGATYSRDA